MHSGAYPLTANSPAIDDRLVYLLYREVNMLPASREAARLPQSFELSLPIRIQPLRRLQLICTAKIDPTINLRNLANQAQTIDH